MFDPTKPVQTRDGRAARIVCTDRKGDQSIIALINVGPSEMAWYFFEDGRWTLSAPESKHDLVNIPVRWSTWSGCYKNGEIGNFSFNTRASAEEKVGSSILLLGYLERQYENGQIVAFEYHTK